ncbi:MAG: efflux RND transporter periplasmic adaptor subunit [Mucinivorans sp.]
MNNRNLLLATALSAFLVSCGGATGAKQSQSEYPILTLDTSSAVVYTDFATEIKSGTVVEIRPRVSGYIDKILVAEGAHISKGEAIFQINQDDLKEEYNMAQANVDAARAKLENAKLEVRKLTPLVEKGIISSYELDNANSNLTAANAALNASISQMNNAKISLSYARITSPVNGVVGRIVVREGTLVAPSNGEPLTTVSGDGDVSAYFSIDENSILDMASTSTGSTLGEKVSRLPAVYLILSNGQQYAKPGRLELASGLVDAATGSYQIKAIFPNPDNALRSGSSGVVRTSEHLFGVILVPQKATYEMQDKKMLFVVDDAGKVQSRTIVVDGRSGQNYVVSSGVEAGEKVVVEGVDFIKDGDIIKIKN